MKRLLLFLLSLPLLGIAGLEAWQVGWRMLFDSTTGPPNAAALKSKVESAQNTATDAWDKAIKIKKVILADPKDTSVPEAVGEKLKESLLTRAKIYADTAELFKNPGKFDNPDFWKDIFSCDLCKEKYVAWVESVQANRKRLDELTGKIDQSFKAYKQQPDQQSVKNDLDKQLAEYGKILGEDDNKLMPAASSDKQKFFATIKCEAGKIGLKELLKKTPGKDFRDLVLKDSEKDRAQKALATLVQVHDELGAYLESCKILFKTCAEAEACGKWADVQKNICQYRIALLKIADEPKLPAALPKLNNLVKELKLFKNLDPKDATLNEAIQKEATSLTATAQDLAQGCCDSYLPKKDDIPVDDNILLKFPEGWQKKKGEKKVWIFYKDGSSHPLAEKPENLVTKEKDIEKVAYYYSPTESQRFEPKEFKATEENKVAVAFNQLRQVIHTWSPQAVDQLINACKPKEMDKLTGERFKAIMAKLAVLKKLVEDNDDLFPPAGASK
jgi:hypothetical protein